MLHTLLYRMRRLRRLRRSRRTRRARRTRGARVMLRTRRRLWQSGRGEE